MKMNNKAQLDFLEFDSVSIVGILMGLVCGAVTIIIMARVPGVNIFFKIMGFVAGCVVGYFASSKITGS